MIYQNDQYFLKIRPKMNGQIVDDSCDDMVIKLGEIIKKKSLNEITYDADLKCWLYPLSIEQSSKSKHSLKLQCWFSFGNSYFDTPVLFVEIGESIIKKDEVV